MHNKCFPVEVKRFRGVRQSFQWRGSGFCEDFFYRTLGYLLYVSNIVDMFDLFSSRQIDD